MWRDESNVLDMLIAARQAREYTEGMSWEKFSEDRRTQDATMRQLEIVGEAARRVSADFREHHPQIPWEQIVAFRNRLLHEYSRVRVPQVWDVLRNEVPELIRSLEPLVPPEDTEETR